MKKLWFIALLVLALGGLVIALAAGDGSDRKTWGDVLQYAFTLIPALAAAIVIRIRNWPELIRSKTFWAGISAIWATVQQFLAGNIDPPTLVFGVLAGLAAIFIRDAQATTAKAVAIRK